MARPIMNPAARFSDVKPIWDHATANGGLIWTADSDNSAIRLSMRLNTYRRAIREHAPDGYIFEDLFIVSRQGNVITIKLRPTPAGTMTTLGGNKPLSPAEAEQRIVHHDELDIETS